MAQSDYNGDGTGYKVHAGPDDYDAPGFAQVTGATLDNILFWITERIILVKPNGRISRSQLRVPSSDRALIALRRRDRKPAPVESLSNSRFPTIEFVAKKTACDADVIRALIDANDLAAIDPKSGEVRVDWRRFDCWWKVAANRDRATRMSRDVRATASADAIKQAAEEQTLEEQLQEANRQANAPWKRALGRDDA